MSINTLDMHSSSGWIFVLIQISLHNTLKGGIVASNTDLVEEAGTVYLSTLSQVRVLQKTMELVDLKGEQVFGKIQLQSLSKVQEMAWTIAQCYDIELNSFRYNNSRDYQSMQVNTLQILHICDHRDHKLNP